jgi:hypothetical protein
MSKRRFKPLGLGAERGNKPPELSARDKLSSSFIKALQKDWAENGVAVIEQIRREQPVRYGELIAKLVPVQIDPPASPYAEAKTSRDLCRLVLEQNGVPEWCVTDEAIERIHAASQALSDEIESIKASVEN